MAKNNGHLTKQDQKQVNREANRLGDRIGADKHSEQVGATLSEDS